MDETVAKVKRLGGSVQVDDCNACVDQAKALGATVVVPPTDVPGDVGRFSMFGDPTGAMISVIQLNLPR